MLPLGRYCADIASDAATIYQSKPIALDEMPGGGLEEETAGDDSGDSDAPTVELFDEVG